MWKLTAARQQAAPGAVVVAQDVRIGSGAVVKRFFSGTVPELRALRDRAEAGHVEPWLRGFHWYEVIDETRPARIFLDVETTASTHVRVREGVELAIALLNQGMDYEGPWHVADASAGQKQSFHVVGGPLVRNLFHVGAAVRRLRCFAQIYRDQCAALFDDKGAFIIDEAVYTRGRQFRLFGARKLGSDRVLRSDIPWWEALVNGAGEARDVLEIDESEPGSTSAGALQLFECVGDKWHRRGSARVMGTTSRHVPRAVVPVLDALRGHDHEIECDDLEFDASYGSWRIPSRSKRCGIAGREHRSNHVWYTLDPVARVVYQRCHDADCGQQSCAVPLDASVWQPLETIFSTYCTTGNI